MKHFVQRYISISKPTLFDALVYDVKSDHKTGGGLDYFGYSGQILIYSALEKDDPLTPKVQIHYLKIFLSIGLLIKTSVWISSLVFTQTSASQFFLKVSSLMQHIAQLKMTNCSITQDFQCVSTSTHQ